jgi:hypothetical protein
MAAAATAASTGSTSVVDAWFTKLWLASASPPTPCAMDLDLVQDDL